MTDLQPAGLFIDLLAAELQTLKQVAAKLSFPAGHIIFQQGDVGNGVYVIEEGMVEISALIKGREHRVLSRLGPNTFFGEMAVVDNQPRSATARAESDTVLAFIPREEMLSALERSPKLLISLIREFSQRMRQFDQRFLEEVLQAESLALVGRFAQSIVHDFKNPLNMIGIAADVAAAEGALPEHRTEAKLIIRKQVTRLSNMISELLEFTRGSTRSVSLLATHYGAFVEQFLTEIAPEMTDKGVAIRCPHLPDVVLQFDSARLLHVFYNLVNNAVDFLPPENGAIEIRFSISDREVVTEIEDNGSGISPEIADRLFSPFATHGKPNGTGLGLSICKRIVEDHKGAIRASSPPGRGAIFSFSLPR